MTIDKTKQYNNSILFDDIDEQLIENSRRSDGAKKFNKKKKRKAIAKKSKRCNRRH